MPTGPPILGFVPLTAGDDREEVNEEDFNDFNDTDDRTAHPQAELSTKVGQEHLDTVGWALHDGSLVQVFVEYQELGQVSLVELFVYLLALVPGENIQQPFLGSLRRPLCQAGGQCPFLKAAKIKDWAYRLVFGMP